MPTLYTRSRNASLRRAGHESARKQRCEFCKRLVPSSSIKRHIQHSPDCCNAWEAIVAAKAARERHQQPDNNRSVAPVSDDAGGPMYNEPRVDAAAESNPSTPACENPYRARVEDAPDEEEEGVRFVQVYPGSAGKILGSGEGTFQRWKRENEEAGLQRWHPFTDENEWQLGRWLVKNAGQNQIDEFLKLPIVSLLTVNKSSQYRCS